MSRMSIVNRKFFTLIFALVALPLSQQAQTLTSPNGQLVLTVEATPNGTTPPASPLLYQVSFHGKAVIERSALRLEFEGQRPLGVDVRILSVTPSAFDSTYRLITGRASEVRDHYNALRVELEEVGGLARKRSEERR